MPLTLKIPSTVNLEIMILGRIKNSKNKRKPHNATANAIAPSCSTDRKHLKIKKHPKTYKTRTTLKVVESYPNVHNLHMALATTNA